MKRIFLPITIGAIFCLMSTAALMGRYTHSAPLYIVLSALLITLTLGAFFLHRLTAPRISDIAISEACFKLAFDHSPIGTALVSPQGDWLKVNAALCRILGYSEAELLKRNFIMLTHADDAEDELKNTEKLNKNEISFYQAERHYQDKTDKTVWVLLTKALVRTPNGMPLYYIVQLQDISEKKKIENALSYQAYFDSLTGLINRNQLEQSLEKIIATALRSQQKFAIFFLDIDHFKHINDSLGHDAGDQLLRAIGERLKNTIRKTDIAARLGGDEFVLLLYGADKPDIAATFAEKIINTLTKPITIKEHEVMITTSIGISFYPADGEDYATLIKSADLALYKSKEAGRNNYRFCTPEINNDIKTKALFKNALQTALHKNEFHLVFQPKQDAIQQRIVGFEALLRWESETYGNVPPIRIIPLTEEIGLISQLGEWIIKTAAIQAAIWQKSMYANLKIAINISPRHYMQEKFVESILMILNDSELSGKQLELEISESLIMQDPDYSLDITHALQQHGVQIIVDNFGTGYSNIDQLQRLAPNSIKIDRSFISDLPANLAHNDLLHAMVELAKNLNVRVLAEGVETREQYDRLIRLGCVEIQGYYIGRPMRAEKIPQFIQQRAVAVP